MEKTASTYQVISAASKNHLQSAAMSFLPDCTQDTPAQELNYSTLVEKITQTANVFYELDLRKNEVVSILLPNIPQMHFAMWGSQAIGIANPINPLLEAEGIISIMNNAQSKILVTLTPSDQLATDKLEKIISNVPSLESVILVGAGNFTAIKPIINFEAAISLQTSKKLLAEDILTGKDIACYLHTGGTTGAPKLAMLTHDNLISASREVVDSLDYQETDVILACLPLFHVFAILASGLAAFMASSKIVMASPKGFRDEVVVKNIWRIVEKQQITIMLGVPTVYNLLATIPIAYKLDKVRFAVCGASPLPLQTILNFENHTGIKILEGYGMTETGGINTVNYFHRKRKAGSVGNAIPIIQIKIVKTNSSEECKANEIGHILVKGKNVFAGYKNIPNSFLPEGWFDTGDLGFLDEENYLWIRGRSKDLIIRGGHNIDPLQIEEILYQHPEVTSAAAIGKPCEKSGELPVAYVTLKNKNITEQELIDFVAERIAERAAIPKNIFKIDVMPVTSVGKIFKPALREDLLKRVAT